MSDQPDEWYEGFWDALGDLDDADDGPNAIRILGECFEQGVIIRDGDHLRGARGDGDILILNASDQYLVRRVQEAAQAGREANAAASR